MPQPQYLRSAEVANLLGVSLSTVDRWCRTGQLPYLANPGKGGWRKFRPADVEKFARSLERQAAS